jgi:hypothetical protein
MNDPAKSAYHSSARQNEEVWALFDFRTPGAGSKMCRQNYAWKSCASIERLDRHHAVLIVRTSGAQELAG